MSELFECPTPSYIHINEREYFIVLPDGRVCVDSCDGGSPKKIVSPYEIRIVNIQCEETSFEIETKGFNCTFWLHSGTDIIRKQLAIARFIYDHVNYSNIAESMKIATNCLIGRTAIEPIDIENYFYEDKRGDAE